MYRQKGSKLISEINEFIKDLKEEAQNEIIRYLRINSVVFLKNVCDIKQKNISDKNIIRITFIGIGGILLGSMDIDIKNIYFYYEYECDNSKVDELLEMEAELRREFTDYDDDDDYYY